MEAPEESKISSPSNPSTKNGILCLYHQFPYFYENLDQMVGQLPHIRRNLQCNAVWVGPLQETGLKKVTRRKKVVWGSQYAMRDHTKFNARLKCSDDGLKKYTSVCSELGLIPIFDLVLNQVAADDDSPIINLLGRENFYEKKNEKGLSLWDDTVWFNYNDVTFREKVIEEFWKPLIKTYIKEYGFKGVRIDAVKHIANEHPEILKEICLYIKKICNKYHKRDPIIFAELLDRNPLEYLETLKKGFGFTHILNSTFESCYSQNARSANQQYGGWNANDWLLKEIGSFQTIIFETDEQKNEVGRGGTLGYVGNHDKLSFGNQIESLIRKNLSFLV